MHIQFVSYYFLISITGRKWRGFQVVMSAHWRLLLHLSLAHQPRHTHTLPGCVKRRPVCCLDGVIVKSLSLRKMEVHARGILVRSSDSYGRTCRSRSPGVESNPQVAARTTASLCHLILMDAKFTLSRMWLLEVCSSVFLLPMLTVLRNPHILQSVLNERKKKNPFFHWKGKTDSTRSAELIMNNSGRAVHSPRCITSSRHSRSSAVFSFATKKKKHKFTLAHAVSRLQI